MKLLVDKTLYKFLDLSATLLMANCTVGAYSYTPLRKTQTYIIDDQ
jgi:hypothetical protein